MTLPIHYIVPLARETRWSDLLAVLIEADPETGFRALGLNPPQGGVTVEREAPSAGRDRIDLLVHDRAGARAVVEVKVLSGLDHRQLERYAEAFPRLSKRVLVLARLPSSLPAASEWESLTWEDVLEQFAQSGNDWVATTARAWRKDLEHRVPRVSTGTIWNEIPAGDDLVLPLRARMAWVFGQLRPPPGVEHDLVESSAGKSWVARMTTQARAENYLIRAEAEESLRGAVTTLRGPRVKICLVQTGVDSSRDFDWDYLLALWAIMAPTRDDWRGSPNPRSAHDRAAIERIRALGAPRHLGIGFGDAQAKKASECMFGAQFRIPPTATVGEVAEQLQSTADLMLALAHEPWPA